MSRRIYVLLFLLALLILAVVASAQAIPGYLDADYYYAGGLQLARGEGFNEPYLWNYLDDPQELPHPSHGYWMPLASIVAALGMWMTGHQTYAAARLGFILLAACVPPLTAALAFTFSERRDLALTSGLLAVFPVFHLAFMPVTDNYPTYMVFGGLYFLVMNRPRPWLWLGLLSGLFTLARSDGLIWLALTIALAIWGELTASGRNAGSRRRLMTILRYSFIAILGFLIVMGPWYFRNFGVYGSFMSPGGGRALWLTNYDETFVYPGNKLTLDSWLASGWTEIIKVRLWALGVNLQTMIAAQGHLILFPFILAGMWNRRADRRVQIGALAWLGLFVVMSLAFPFAGVRGSFFHAGAALQPLLWSLAPLGLELAVAAIGRRRAWVLDQAQVVFRIGLIQIVIMLSGYLVWFRIFEKGWQEGEYLYPVVERYLVEQGIAASDVVMALNSPAYYIMTGRSAVAQPYGDEATVLAVAERFGVRYFVFESEGQLKPLQNLYINPESHPRFRYLGEVNGARIFEIRTED
jgi:hypothetical protein